MWWINWYIITMVVMITYRAIESASNDLEIFSKSASQSGFEI